MLVEASQQRIADSLGVSIATVNRALRDHKGTNPLTRARVLKAAFDMGYRAERRKGSRPAPARAFQLGVLMQGGAPGDSASHVSLRMLSGIAAEARRQELSIGVDYIPRSEAASIAEPERQSSGLRDGIWDGVIICGHYPLETTRKLAARHLTVQIGDYLPGLGVDCVDHDDLESCEALVELLWSLGHRRIAFLGESLYRLQLPCSATRAAGCAAAVLRRCGSFEPLSVFNVDGLAPEAESFANVERQLKNGVTGWICVHDGLGYRLLSHLRSKGIRCPDSVSVCGFDNLEPPSSLVPKLDSVEAPFERMGEMAVLRLLSKIKREASEPMHMIFRTSLAKGASCAPFKAWAK